jgi:ABC-type amino acid transport substrate-binding protein
MPMIRSQRAAALLLALTLLMGLNACEREGSSGYKVLDTLDSEVLNIAFRSGDTLRDMVSAALSELAAAGEISSLSAKWLGKDYSCLEGEQDALKSLSTPKPGDRLLLVGVEKGAAPMSSSSGGTFTGLIPDLAKRVCEKLGWRVKFMPISSADAKVELSSGNVDCVWTCASFDESTGNFSVSPGYLENEHLLLVRRDSGINRNGKLAGRPIAVTGDPGASAALKTAKLRDSAGVIWTYDTVQGCFDALDQGICDALVVDSVVASHYMY